MSDRPRGFALLVVLLTMGFLALLGTQLVAAGRSDTRLAYNLKQAATLEAAADGAVQRAVFAITAAHDPDFKVDGPDPRIIEGGVPVVLRIRNEGDRVNVNTCSLALMQALLTEVGATPDEASRLAAAILDWRTGGRQARPGGAKAPQYVAAGLPYGPPGTPFESVDELNEVLGMTPALYAQLAPHVTVLTDGDPDLSTHDPVVARALADAAGVAQDADVLPQSESNLVLRITATAIGSGNARYAVTEIAMGDYRGMQAQARILFRER